MRCRPTAAAIGRARPASQSSLADGDYQFRAVVTDPAGNSATSNAIEVVVDNTAPAAGTLSFANLNDTGSSDTPPVTQDSTFDLSLAGQEAGATVAYEVSTDNGSHWSSTTAVQSSLADGDYQFRAVVTDAAGNSANSNIIEVVVDTAVSSAAVAITAVADDTGASATDFVTSDTTLVVSGSNGALAGDERI